MIYHTPVMLTECLEGLNINPQGTYVDLTFGGGGHSKAILEKLTTQGRLLAFDQDEDAKQLAQNINQANFTFIQANFRFFKKYLRLHKVNQVDGILADLGISSHQIDTPERGFSIRFEGDLDMRMDQQAELTAQTIVNEYSESELHKILGIYGEVKNARTLAIALVRERVKKPIHTIEDLKKVASQYAPKGLINKYLAQVFQALRIEVNDEMKVLEEMLLQTADVLKPQGRLVMMAYHSLEDRLVKNYIQKGKFSGEVEKDIYGNFFVPFQAINRKPITPSDAEIAENNRARSAKLRIAEKV
jgi:16S rRNA (cytosine1402-N4)-methyltransferase